MPTRLPARLLIMLAAVLPGTRQTTFAAALPPDLQALVQCDTGIEGYARLIEPVENPLAAVALGWQPLPRTNPFLAEYRLAQPINVFTHDADHLVVSGGTVMVALDRAQHPPQALARQLDLEIVIDDDGKFMAGREVMSRDNPHPDTGVLQIESAILGVSTVASHPDSVLVGCTYSLDEPEEAPPMEAALPGG